MSLSAILTCVILRLSLYRILTLRRGPLPLSPHDQTAVQLLLQHPLGFLKESGEFRETLGRESEKPSIDKALIPPAQIPERFESLAHRSGKIGEILVRRAHPPLSRAIREAKGFFDARPPSSQRGLACGRCALMGRTVWGKT